MHTRDLDAFAASVARYYAALLASGLPLVLAGDLTARMHDALLDADRKGPALSAVAPHASEDVSEKEPEQAPPKAGVAARRTMLKVAPPDEP